MGRQVAFVITVDIDKKEAFIDDALFMAKFGRDEQVWDSTAQEWQGDADNKFYYQALEILNNTPFTKG